MADGADPDMAPEMKAENSDNILSDTLRDISDALDVDDENEVRALSGTHGDAMDSEEDDVAAILSRLDREAGDMVSADTGQTEFTTPDQDIEDNILASLETGIFDDANDDEDEDDSEQNFFETEAEAEETAEAAPTPPPAPRTRVLKVKRATLEAAIVEGKLEEYDDTEEAPAPETRQMPGSEGSSLSSEEEAELEADMAAPRKADRDAAAAEQDAHSLDEMAVTANQDFSRLMAETDSHMDEPESATRRDAFAHLRAAVAAKKAEEAVGGPDTLPDANEAYRDDLANVVRPRRTTALDGSRTERPAEPRPAPLKLVAEQRIDTDRLRKAGPVRPRRVAAVVDNTIAEHDADITSFEDFVADVGAQGLSELLEAAASYLSFVEGKKQFSRPQLMTKVRMVEKENFTREDGLRSFGKLLREGKIQKIRGGRFQASDDINFKPDTRAFG